MLTLDVPVAKKSTRKPTPKADDTRKGVVAHVRGSDEFKAWLEEYAAFKRQTVSVTIEHCLVESAERAGFKAPPRR